MVARFLIAIASEERTARFLESVRSGPAPDLRIYLAQVNGAPGLVATSGGGPISALAPDVYDVYDGIVQTIHLVANPEKPAGVRPTESP